MKRLVLFALIPLAGCLQSGELVFEEPDDEIIVIDDHSSDRTSEIGTFASVEDAVSLGEPPIRRVRPRFSPVSIRKVARVTMRARRNFGARALQNAATLPFNASSQITTAEARGKAACWHG